LLCCARQRDCRVGAFGLAQNPRTFELLTTGDGRGRARLFLYGGRRLDEWLPEIVERIVERFDPLKVIMFGSLARGEVDRDSDVDLLVVMPDEIEDERRVTVEILRALRDLPVSKDIVVTTPEEIERRGDLVGTVFRPALREDKVLYERT
jgi:predicted nucleotidyltransferase